MKRWIAILVVLVLIAAAALIVVPKIQMNNAIKAANTLMTNGEYDAAIEAFKALGAKGYSEASVKADEAEVLSRRKKYTDAQKLLDMGDYDSAVVLFDNLGSYEDSIKYSMYAKCLTLGENGEYQDAVRSLQSMGDFAEASLYVTYYEARALEDAQQYEQANEAYTNIITFHDSADRRAKLPNMILDRNFAQARALLERGDGQAFHMLSGLAAKQYTDSETRMFEQIEALAQARFNAGEARTAREIYDVLKHAGAPSADAGYEMIYQAAAEKLDAREYDAATELFRVVRGYRDAADQAQESQYQKGAELLAAADYDGATAVFNGISDYRDAADQAQESQYQKGTVLLAAADYDGATAVFGRIPDYRDAANQAQESQYQKGTALLTATDYDGAVVVFISIQDYIRNAEKKQEALYQKANELYAASNYVDAYRIYLLVKSYKDVDKIIRTDKNLLRASFFVVGNIVTFGNYDGEAIQWRVLENKDDGRCVLLSEYALKAGYYHTDSYYHGDKTWETCSLRGWLNGEFYKNAFTKEERAKIQLTYVVNQDSGEDTHDYVFLLSPDEANTYFSSDDDRICKVTSQLDNGACIWYLRGIGDESFAPHVHHDGSISYKLHVPGHKTLGCIRPVIVLQP